MNPIPVRTTSWRVAHEYRPRGGDPPEFVPVRISVGLPRFWPEARGFPAVDALMPRGRLFKLTDEQEFTPLYREKLDRIGVDAILEQFAAIYDDYAVPLVLCCYENLALTWCHRRVAAAWIEERTGWEVPEL